MLNNKFICAVHSYIGHKSTMYIVKLYSYHYLVTVNTLRRHTEDVQKMNRKFRIVKTLMHVLLKLICTIETYCSIPTPTLHVPHCKLVTTL